MRLLNQVKSLLGIQSEKEKIITRLLSNHEISPKEAIELLRGDTHITIKVTEMSSGAKLVIGEDNETNNR